jgi:hypothetical protein
MSTPSSSLEALSTRPIPLRVPHGARDDRGEPLSPDELRNIDAYWRASLYLCVESCT